MNPLQNGRRRNLISLIVLGLYLSACGTKSGTAIDGAVSSANGGVADTGGTSIVTPPPDEPAACLRALPELRVANFTVLTDAVSVFTYAAQKCGVSRGQLQTHARWMENQGTRILNTD